MQSFNLESFYPATIEIGRINHINVFGMCISKCYRFDSDKKSPYVYSYSFIHQGYRRTKISQLAVFPALAPQALMFESDFLQPQPPFSGESTVHFSTTFFLTSSKADCSNEVQRHIF